MDYYKVLGLTPSASEEDIRKAFRKLSVKFHPDKNDGDPYFENMFIRIRQAYECLSNPINRKKYDAIYKSENNFNNNSKNYFEPVIENFSCNKKDFYCGDEIIFRWSCFNADNVVLKPFGSDSISGSKIYKINNFNQEFFIAELIATNTLIGKSKSMSIKLENSLYKDIFNQKVAQLKSDEKKIAEKYKWYNEKWIINTLVTYSFLFFFASFFFTPFIFYGVKKNVDFSKEQKKNFYIGIVLATLITLTFILYQLPDNLIGM